MHGRVVVESKNKASAECLLCEWKSSCMASEEQKTFMSVRLRSLLSVTAHLRGKHKIYRSDAEIEIQEPKS